MSEDLQQCIGLQIKLTCNIMANEHNKYLKDSGVSAEQGLLLKFVYEFPGCTQTQLAEALHKDKTTITRMIDTLEKKSAIYRKASPHDRRVQLIYVTDDTQKKVEQISPLFEKRNEELKEIIDASEYAITLQVLEKIQNYYRGLNK